MFMAGLYLTHENRYVVYFHDRSNPIITYAGDTSLYSTSLSVTALAK